MAPPIVMADKTRRMYAALGPADFTDGGRTREVVERVRLGREVRGELLYNVFERAALEVFEGLAAYREAFREAAGGEVWLAGAGPAMFSLHGSREEAEEVAGRLGPEEGRVFVARTLTGVEATGLTAG